VSANPWPTGRGPSGAGAPRKDGPNLERDNPQEPRPVDRRANPPAPGRLGPWGSSVPRGTPTAFPSLVRESLVLRPEGRLNLTTATGVAHTHRPAVRRPGPSALLAGAPTRISRSSRVGPSGRLNRVGAHEVAVKATFPLARRVCPASGGSNYFDGIWGDEPSPWTKRAPGAHRFSGTATGGHTRAFSAWSRVPRHKQPTAGSRRRSDSTVTPRLRSPVFCTQSVVSSVSATGPCEPAHNNTAKLLTVLPTWCDVVSGEAPLGPVCGCHRDGMQEGRGSNPLSSTPIATGFLQLSGGGFRAAIAPLV
jgi:hypothetical protein